MSKIQWTEEVWNPLAGCTPVSPGCANCYAATMAKRLAAMGRAKYAGTVDTHGRWTGKINFDEKALALPLRVKKPTVWFVNSMSDLFHEAVPFEFVDRVFAVMAICRQHRFQVLTKRAERMREYCGALSDVSDGSAKPGARVWKIFDAMKAIQLKGCMDLDAPQTGDLFFLEWPLRNVWLGVSVEDQARAEERIPALLGTPAAVRFLSCEPLLGAVDLSGWLELPRPDIFEGDPLARTLAMSAMYDGLGHYMRALDLVIVGGESGARARGCEGNWIRGIREQCKANGVAFFLKQLGAAFWDEASGVIGKSVKIDRSGEGLFRRLKDAKGGVMEEWPEEFRVREMPE